MIKVEVQGTDGNMTLNVSIDEKALKTHEETLGRYVLFTNRKEWTPEAIIWAYRELYIVEYAFRDMKSPTAITVRPMYHHADTCIRAHVFVCVISLLLLSLLRLKLARKSVPASYDEILGELRFVHILKVLASPKAKPLWKLDKTNEIATKFVKKLNLKRLLEN